MKNVDGYDRERSGCERRLGRDSAREAFSRAREPPQVYILAQLPPLSPGALTLHRFLHRVNRALEATLSQAFGPPVNRHTPALDRNLVGLLFLLVFTADLNAGLR